MVIFEISLFGVASGHRPSLQIRKRIPLSLHSPSNALIFGLALRDLGVGLIVEPLTVVYFVGQHNGSAHVFCITAVVLRMAGISLISASLNTVTAVSLDMYLALFLHLRYREIVTMKRIAGVLVGIMFIGVAIGLLNIWYREYLIVPLASSVLLNLLVTMTAYFKVFRILRHHEEQIRAQNHVQEQAEDPEEGSENFSQKKKASLSKFLIFCLLVACYLPYGIVSVTVQTFNPSVSVNSIYKMLLVLVCLNSTLNPIIYCWRFQTIRVAVIETTKKLFRRQRMPSA